MGIYFKSGNERHVPPPPKPVPPPPPPAPDRGTGLGRKLQKKLQKLSDKYPAPDQTTRMKKGSKQK